MRQSEEVHKSSSGGLVLVAVAILAALSLLAIASAANAHGRKAVPSDPMLLEQYQAGLAAYLKRDHETALQVWQPLAERETESSAAQLFLGFMHAKGLGSARDPAAAAEWYRRAAEQDNMLAQIRLAFMYRRGEGVARDQVRAYVWAILAARQESHVQTVAEALREVLAMRMTPSQIAEAERRAATWSERHGAAE